MGTEIEAAKLLVNTEMATEGTSMMTTIQDHVTDSIQKLFESSVSGADGRINYSTTVINHGIPGF